MHADLDYEVLRHELPENVVPAYDGMKLQIEGSFPASTLE
jgi:phosphoribosyl 1,2-cyclic phosphate phosphodiesterase